MYSKTCLKQPPQKGPKISFQDRLSLNAGQKFAECSNGSILQYFQPSLSYHLSIRPLICLFLSGRFRQVLLYFMKEDDTRNHLTTFFIYKHIYRWSNKWK